MAYAVTSIQAVFTMAVSASVSQAVRVPRNMNVATFFTPSALAGGGPVIPGPMGGVLVQDAGVGGSWKIQSALPLTDPDSNVWVDAYGMDPATGNQVQLTFGYVANQALSIPAWFLGGGDIRISTYDVTQPTAVTWTIMFSGFNN